MEESGIFKEQENNGKRKNIFIKKRKMNIKNKKGIKGWILKEKKEKWNKKKTTKSKINK